jgi:hypothetical protein
MQSTLFIGNNSAYFLSGQGALQTKAGRFFAMEHQSWS